MGLRAEGYRIEVPHLCKIHFLSEAAEGTSRVRLLYGGDPGTLEGRPLPFPALHVCGGIHGQRCSGCAAPSERH